MSNETVNQAFYGPFESSLARRVDTAHVSSLFDEIEAGRAFRLSGDDFETVLLYLALQLTRTPAFRSLADDMLQENLREYVRADRRPGAQRLLGEIHRRPAAFGRDLGENIALMLDVAAGIVQHLLVMKGWVIHPADDGFFITSDCPVAVGPFFEGQDRPLGLRDDAVVFALSPRTALLLCSHLPENRYVEAHGDTDKPKLREIVANVNRLIGRRCNRWLYSDREFAPDALGWQFPLARFRTVTQRIGPGFVRTRDVLTTGTV